MARIKAVIFDLDGLLVDSEPLWVETRRQTLRKFGQEYDINDKKNTMGRGHLDVARYLIKKHNLSVSAEDFVEMESKLLEKLLKEKAKLMPGALSFIKQLDQRNILKAVASSSSRRRIEIVLDKLGINDFRAIIAGDEVSNGKPNPEIFLKGAEKLGVNSEDCVVLEDSLNGVMAAKAAGMLTVAVADKRFNMREDFDNAKPDLIVDSLEGLTLEKLQGLAE